MLLFKNNDRLINCLGRKARNSKTTPVMNIVSKFYSLRATLDPSIGVTREYLLRDV